MDSVTLNKTKLTLIEGQSVTLVAKLKPTGVHATVVWASDNEAVATVDQNGTVTAVAPGKATINVKARHAKTKCVVTVLELTEIEPTAEPTARPMEAMDLGVIITREDGTRFKLYWRDANLGTEGPLLPGDYYAWGETQTKPQYTSGNYKWNGASDKYSQADGKTQLDLKDDVAHVLLGDRWRMPTLEEWKALQTQCIWEYNDGDASTGGRKGWWVRGRDGHSGMFLPEAGQYSDKVWSYNTAGYYLSSSIWKNEWGKAGVFIINSVKCGVGSNTRVYGASIRPVWVGELTEEMPYKPKAEMEFATQNDDDLGIDIIEYMPQTTTTVVAQPEPVEEPEPVKEVKVLGAVDLGVVITRQDGTSYKLLVAECNLGAEKPEEAGNYYAWGETRQKITYNRATYKFFVNPQNFSKYCPLKEEGFWYSDAGLKPDSKSVLDPEDDAAHVNLGGSWRIPYMEEIMALREQCNWTWATINGIPGYLVSSKEIGNMNFIFLPAAGIRANSKVDSFKKAGYYSFANLSDGFSNSAQLGLRAQRVNDSEIIHFDSDTVVFDRGNREYGYAIRPVIAKELDASVDDEPFRPNIVDLGLMVTRPGRAPYKLYWADCNLGARKPEGYGDAFTWGDTEPNYSSYIPLVWRSDYFPGYSASAYKWSGPNGSYKKYDRTLILEPEDDAAHVVLGEGWRMPDKYEWDALSEQCVWEWTNVNGVLGYKVRGNTGNSIFLPAAGYYEHRERLWEGDSGFYVLPILSEGDGNAHLCKYFFFNSENHHSHFRMARHFGYSVRPVTE